MQSSNLNPGGLRANRNGRAAAVFKIDFLIIPLRGHERYYGGNS